MEDASNGPKNVQCATTNGLVFVRARNFCILQRIALKFSVFTCSDNLNFWLKFHFRTKSLVFYPIVDHFEKTNPNPNPKKVRVRVTVSFLSVNHNRVPKENLLYGKEILSKRLDHR